MIAIKRIYSAEADNIVKDEELANRICDDYTDHSSTCLPPDSFYFGFFLDDQCIGFVQLSPDTAVTYSIHINIISSHRDIAIDCAKIFYRFALDTFSPRFQKLIAKVPVTFPDVYRFAKKCGFKDEGLDRKSILRGGDLIDRHILGITREEMVWAAQ